MSTPKPASRSRRPTTITAAERSDKTRASFARLPYNPQPTSATTSPTSIPASVAPGQPGYLTIQLGTLIMAEHPRTQHSTLVTLVARRRDVDQARTHPYTLCGSTATDRAHTANFTRTRRTDIRSHTHIHPRFAQQFNPGPDEGKRRRADTLWREVSSGWQTWRDVLLAEHDDPMSRRYHVGERADMEVIGMVYSSRSGRAPEAPHRLR